MKDIFRIGFCIMFKTEGLNVDWITNDLKARGCDVTGISEDYAIVSDGTPITTIFANGSLAALTSTQLAYNLLEDKEHKWHYWAMASAEEVVKARKMEKNASN